MRIIIVTQYFWPENFRINDLAMALSQRGHIVEILTGKPNYGKQKLYQGYSFFNKRSEVWNGMRIYRSPLLPRGKAGGISLALNYLSFAIFAGWRALFIKGNVDKIIVYETSPVTVGIPAIVLKWIKKAPIYFWVQDLWPHSVVAAGGSSNRTVIGALDRLTRWIYKKCDRILIQSEGFRSVIVHQGVPNGKIRYYPNSAESMYTIREEESAFLERLPSGFKIMFAGNIGEAQDFETLLKAACIVRETNDNIKWVILGDGRRRDYVEHKVRELALENNFLLLGAFPAEQMPYFFACADCLLVSLKKEEIFGLTIPSKMQSYMACGKPILGSLEGEGANILISAGAGLVSESENPAVLASKVLEFSLLSHTDLAKMGENARRYFEANFERELLVTRLEAILREE